VPRTSPEFTIYGPSGKQTLLSSFKGKVVMLEFLFIRSPKCLELAQTMNKLSSELGQRGFQPVAIAFPAPGSNADGPSVAYIVDYFKLTYPVGYATKASVDSYLDRTGSEILNIPQVVIIDRSGMIRATSGGRGGDPGLENENSLRSMIVGLLKENAPVGSNKK
jgi:peroxiredoxin